MITNASKCCIFLGNDYTSLCDAPNGVHPVYVRIVTGMDNRDVYEYGWGLKGQRIYGQRPGKKRERISMMSGYHLGKLIAPFIIVSQENATL